jgi:glucose/arabinose dehydrogenase
VTAVVAALAVATLTACGGGDPAPAPPATEPGVPAVPSPSGTPLWQVTQEGVSVRDTVASGLATPSGVAFLPDGAALVAQRDGRVVRVGADGAVADAGTVPGVEAAGDGGLLGLAAPASKGSRTTVFAYLTSGSDNRVVRMPLEDGRLGAPETVVDGLPAGEGTNGGGLAVGPDGKLYVGTGEGDGSGAQDRRDLGGKILRLDLDGEVPKDNPFRGSPVWTLGHRNVEGLAFDAGGGLWATDSGQERYQELNRIRRGRNYGWPRAEGKDAEGRDVKAFFAWREREEVSPGGLAIVADVAYVADQRGGRLWKLPLADGADSGESLFGGLYGPLRTVAAAPSGDELWLATSAGEGDGGDGGGGGPPGEDRILRLTVRGG